MDYEKEISFGAFDSELMRQEIYIPEGFEATIEGNKIILKKIESEDEMIKQKIIKLIKKSNEVGGYALHKWEADEMLAWLEKQSEQKLPIEKLPSEMKTIGESFGFTTQKECDEYNKMVSDLIMSDKKDKPKFKVGDWVVDNNGKVAIIYDLQKAGYVGHFTDGTDFVCKYSDEHLLHLWTIDDAKGGDVLAEDTCIFIIKKLNHDLSAEIYCCLFDDGDFEINSKLVFDDTCTYPATKKQRDLLFQKVKEAGYEWNAEKKELKKIENKYKIPFVANGSELQETTYYIPKGFHAEVNDGRIVIKKGEKPAEWSEEDEEQVSIITNIVKAHCGKLIDCRSNLSWLKSLKDRVQPKQEWSEENEKIISEVIQNYESGFLPSVIERDRIVKTLKSLKDRVQPQNWTKEDKEKYISCLKRLGSGNPEQPETINSKWFKEHVYPQTTWKPSDEQMHYLNWIANVKLGDSVVEQEVSKHLNELYEDLKKLKGK